MIFSCKILVWNSELWENVWKIPTVNSSLHSVSIYLCLAGLTGFSLMLSPPNRVGSISTDGCNSTLCNATCPTQFCSVLHTTSNPPGASQKRSVVPEFISDCVCHFFPWFLCFHHDMVYMVRYVVKWSCLTPLMMQLLGRDRLRQPWRCWNTTQTNQKAKNIKTSSACLYLHFLTFR